MKTYTYEFDKDEIISNIEQINARLEEERKKEEIDREKERKLIMQQFIQGLKLSTLQNTKKYNF